MASFEPGDPVPEIVRLACGWFLERDAPAEQRYEAMLCDPYGPEPDRGYGPAAWAGEVGPVQAQRLLTLRMVDYDRWNSAVEDTLYDETAPDPGPPCVWPARVSVTEYGRSLGLASLDGTIIESRVALLRQIAPIVAALPARPVPVGSAAGRLAAAHAAMPHIFSAPRQAGIMPAAAAD